MTAVRSLIVELQSAPRAPGHFPNWLDKTLHVNLLPVYSDWQLLYALTPDGEPLSSDSDTWTTRTPLAGVERNAVLAQASTRYPSLAHLRPERSATSSLCPYCRGTGSFDVGQGDPTISPGRVICSCGGLGWVP